ncbi:hypothetical protein EST38_g6566 [Candolleomyces aberdarensis]|uniref:Uncharacterized protein n=1 Tax=Candolleomyces aberdarensis TaxID=2316362 RepID=A0A4Q2DHC2_9AGAR|nr:hypothetical protein EST38_g6566 [Candolleomyces aberdarensis]
MAAATRYVKLGLGPGTVPSRKRRISGCKCMLLAVGILILLVSIGIARFVSSVLHGVREPHNLLYENKTLAEVKNMSTIVRPLVDRDQRFDIVATVWVRTLDSGDNASGQYDWMHGEDHVFSDTVFRGVTLMDEHVHTKVNLSIPLETFSKAETLENFDIRASFKLVPQSPSLLDHITNFTSWVPATVVLPDISPEAHARKIKGDFSPPETLEDLKNAALEAFAVSAPLIDLHPIKSACGWKSKEEEDGPVLEAPALVISTKGKAPLQRHPYVVTRTDLRVVRMDKIYNKKAYDAYHNQLRWNHVPNGCIKAELGAPKDGRKCIRQFESRANCEARIELEIPDEKTSTPQKQVAYAPFLFVNRRSWGPLDVIPMPVNRERCPEGSVPDTFNTTDTEFKKGKAQQTVEITQRIHGHKHSISNRIGRMLVFDAIWVIINFIRLNLQFHYWYTRPTTVGISIIGAPLTALSFFLYFAVDLWEQKAFREGKPLLSSIYALVMAVYWYILTASVILRTVLRLEGTNAFPYVTFMPASHLERASARLETKGRRWWIIGTFIGVFTFNFIDTLRDLPVVSRLGSAPDPVSADVTAKAIENYLANPFFLSGTIFQVVLNYRSKTFAGGYRLAVWMHLVLYLIGLAEYIPWLAWRAGGLREPFSLGGAVRLGWTIVFAVQSPLYMKIEQDIEDKDTG